MVCAATVAAVAVDPERIGQAIRDARGNRPQRDVAALAGIGPDSLSDIELGKSEPKLSNLERIAQALGLTLHALLLRAGAIDPGDPHSVEDMIARDPSLSPDSRELLLRTYARFVDIDREVTDRPLPASPADGAP